jgi:hypothetical protein
MSEMTPPSQQPSKRQRKKLRNFGRRLQLIPPDRRYRRVIGRVNSCVI